MTKHEPIPTYTIVDGAEYNENISNRVRIEDMAGSNEVFVFYATISKMSHLAIRAHTSVDVEKIEANGIIGSGSVTFRDMDFSPASEDYGFPGIFHASFFVPDRSTPILVRPGVIRKVPINMGFLVRGDDGYEGELLEAAVQPSLDRESELVRN